MAPNQKINLKDKVEDGELDLSMCDLQEVPVKEIAAYKKIYSIDLSNNHLVQLPKTFPTLTNITKLDLSKNKLKALPENFGNLVKLKHLDLYKNDLIYLPVSFADLKSLKWLDLKDNPLVPVMNTTAGQCLDNKQCQECAANVVFFFTQLKEKIEEEREAREKQRQKNKLANEVAAQKAKQLEKKNKKKEKAKQEEKHSTIYSEQLPEVLKTEVDTHLEKKSKESIGFIPFTFILLSFACMVLFVLTSVKYEETKFIEENIIKYWAMCLNKAPPMIQNIGNITGTFIGNVHQKVGQHIYELEIHDNVVHYVDKVKEYYNFVLHDNK